MNALDELLSVATLYTPEASLPTRDSSSSGSTILHAAAKDLLQEEVDEVLSEQVLQSLLCDSEAVFPEEVQPPKKKLPNKDAKKHDLQVLNDVCEEGNTVRQ